MAEASGMNERQSNDSCWQLRNVEETISLGEQLIEIIPNLKILLLQGPLGAGKTSLVKGIATSLGIHEAVTSPTFALSQHYWNPKKKALIHLDLYRLENHKAADELFLQEEEESEAINAIMVIEWPERLSLKLYEAWKLELDFIQDGGRSAYLQPPKEFDKNFKTSSS